MYAGALMLAKYILLGSFFAVKTVTLSPECTSTKIPSNTLLLCVTEAPY